MKQLTKMELLGALRDPWEWCKDEIRRRNLTSAYLSDECGISRPSVRALYNGRSAVPGYPLLVTITRYLLETRNESPLNAPMHRGSGLLPGLSAGDLPTAKDLKKTAA